VVTYNNLELTKACLASSDAHSYYGNLEVIVVDNASSDGTREYLAEWVSGASDRKIIANEQNKVFAAANNQGLATRTVDYLFLLNNDTFVTPADQTLARHLERNRTSPARSDPSRTTSGTKPRSISPTATWMKC
jgi:GT2 family glycosyltransferase